MTRSQETTISTDGGGYRAHGMKKADWNAYLDAIEWIRQQLERRK